MRQELGQQLQVEAPIFVAKEDRLPVIPALRNVMRSSWDNLALRPWHQQLSALKPPCSRCQRSLTPLSHTAFPGLVYRQCDNSFHVQRFAFGNRTWRLPGGSAVSSAAETVTDRAGNVSLPSNVVTVNIQ